MNVRQANAAFRLRRWLLGSRISDERATEALAELIAGAAKRLQLPPEEEFTAEAIAAIRTLRDKTLKGTP